MSCKMAFITLSFDSALKNKTKDWALIREREPSVVGITSLQMILNNGYRIRYKD